MDDLIAKLPDEGALRELARRLRAESPDVAIDTVRRILSDDKRPTRRAGLKLAAKVIRQHQDVVDLLDLGLARKDVSEVELWLDTTAQVIGYAALIKHLLQVAPTKPDWIVYAWYQLVPLVRQKAANQAEPLRQVEQATDAALAGGPEDTKSFWERT